MSDERKPGAVESVLLKPGGTGALCRAGMVGAMFVPAWQRVLPTAKDGIVLVVWTMEMNEPPAYPSRVGKPHGWQRDREVWRGRLNQSMIQSVNKRQ